MFVEHLKQIPAETIVSVDECGVATGLQGEYSYRLKGERNGKRDARENILARLCDGIAIAPWIFSMPCDTDFVLQGLQASRCTRSY